MARSLRGKCAIASAKLAFQSFRETFSSDRFQPLEKRGALPQHLLWASMSVKDSAYDELMYADALVGPDTVDTMPDETLRAFLERGRRKTFWRRARTTPRKRCGGSATWAST
ncbi:MAG: transaldolase family protein [Bryobacterales bacterium]